MSEATFKIAETFYSLQGEGKYLGVPSYFIRLSGCPMRCIWCDTPYASWEPEGELWDLSEIQEDLDKYPQAGHVVITGGEPYSFPNIAVLVDFFKKQSKIVTMETAGIHYIETQADLISLSPKTSHSDPIDTKHVQRHRKLRKNLKPLQGFVQNSQDVQWKFVVQSREDLEEIRDILSESGVYQAYTTHALHQVYLMPFTEDAQQFENQLKKVADWCLQEGYSLSHRLHVQLWNDERGT